VSGPARPATARGGARPQARPAAARRPALGDLPLLDRLVRGRIWIVLLATALVGLVFLQVSLLKLNSGISRAVQSSATLERQNAVLRGEVSRLGDGQRIQGAATGLGLVMPGPGDRRYLDAGGSADATRAANGITAPSPVVQEPLPPGLAPTTGPVGTAATATTPPAAPATPVATPAPAATTATAPPAQTQAPAQPQTQAPAAAPAQQTTAPPTASPTGGTSADPAAG